MAYSLLLDQTSSETGLNCINIDRVLERTEDGKSIMENLKANKQPAESITKKISYILCDCLKYIYGCRPSNFYKNQIALSLVRSYPISAAKGSDVPQALWFHAHARGVNRHAGRIHYRMEYLARKSEQRVVKRRRINETPAISPVTKAIDTEDFLSPEELNTSVDELKFITPNAQSRNRIVEVWNKTVSHLLCMLTEDTDQYVNYFPVLSAFNGLLISMDFKYLQPSAKQFTDRWDDMEPKILRTHREVCKELRNDFVRALSIVRLKNPSRGSKMYRSNDTARKNPLYGIVEWVEISDEPSHEFDVPIIIARGIILPDTDDCTIHWRGISIPVGDLKSAFEVLLQLTAVFKIDP
ncbi:uncharacterized protein LOC129733254 isoform X2 [Wyeomyia smithii]|uniref:uncharacterized protein LOC129733254 isoform X2 n=1 Tax=Wyeomyia smithii TaxID=174621 RepID=UPI002467DEC8|nr:uncharacterized protein LOC129733254 isoform X2 [Wyeomyia smithii]